MLIMLREPAIMPSIHSHTPWRNAFPIFSEPRITALMGCWVSVTTIIAIAAQKAENPGERRSMTMHQIRMMMGRT